MMATNNFSSFRSYVYFITDDHGHIKIGKANDVWFRLKELQTGNPYKLRILLTIGMRSEYEAFDLEQRLHEKFRTSRMEGEWFHEHDIIQFLSDVEVEVDHYRFLGRGTNFYKEHYYATQP